MSKWTHTVCDVCWAIMNGARKPVRVVEKEDEKCCICGKPHRSGIYMRGDPENWMCGGKHS